MESKGCIYRAYLPSGISYIGQTVDFEKRKKRHWHLRNHEGVFHNAISIFGFDSFNWEILEDNIPESELNSKEIYWISYFDSFDCGFNHDTGGGCSYITRHRKHTAEEKQLMKKNHTHRKPTEDEKREQSKRFSGEGNPMYGKKQSAESKQKNRLSHLGRIPWNKGLKKETDERVAIGANKRNNTIQNKKAVN